MGVKEASEVYRLTGDAIPAKERVPPAYKRTEVGIIPEEWTVMSLGDLFSFAGGLSASRDDLGMDGYRYLHYGDIHTSSKSFIDVSEDWIPRIEVKLSRVSKKSLLCDGDVVFVDASEDEEGASKHVVVRNRTAVPFISGLHTIIAKPKGSDLDIEFRCYGFQGRTTKDQFRFYAAGTKVLGVSKSNIKKIQVVVPPLAEQVAIAELLSDADALIESLQQLIAKKRALKQGAMQTLLSGLQRLPGFNQEWRIRKLDDFGEVYGGLSGKTKRDFGYGRGRFVTFMGVISNVVIDMTKLEPVDVLASESQNAVSEGDLLFNGSSETPQDIGLCAVVNEQIDGVYLNSFCFGYRMRSDAPLSPLYLAYFYRSHAGRELLAPLAQGAIRYNLSKRALLELEFALPPKEEQTAIATVLSDLDAEIDALDARLAKTRALKVGMMQALLTGRIRLPLDEVA